MRDQSRVERPYQLILPEAGTYAVDDILNLICAAEYPGDLHSTEGTAGARYEFREYLIERLLKAVVEGKFELWDLYLKKVVAPPVKDTIRSTRVSEDSQKKSSVSIFWRFLTKTFTRPPEPDFIKALSKPPVVSNTIRLRQSYKTNFWWAKMTNILRPDLVKFCNGERISVVFDGDGEQADEQKSRPATAIELESENQESIVPPAAVQPEQKTVISGEKVLADSKLPGTKPKGKSKPVGKGKIADQALKGFDDLPDSGHVDVRVVAALFGCSVPTVWRRVRSGQLVAPHKLGERTTRWKVGELRDALRKGSSSPAEETPTPVAPPPLAGSSLENKAKRTKLADHGNEQQSKTSKPADIPNDSTKREQTNEPHATVRTNSTKQRYNELDSAIDKAVSQAGSLVFAHVYLILKEMALNEEAPFTGGIDGGGLCYTNDHNKADSLTRDGLRSRLRTRRLNAS